MYNLFSSSRKKNSKNLVKEEKKLKQETYLTKTYLNDSANFMASSLEVWT